MINEFKKNLMTYFSNKEKLVKDNDKLTQDYNELYQKHLQALEERAKLFDKVNTLRESLNSALDEIVINQKRIDSLLRQLKEKMVENKKDKIIELYDYYTNMIDTMLNDMSNIKLNDIHDVIDELHVELNKIGDIREDESNPN